MVIIFCSLHLPKCVLRAKMVKLKTEYNFSKGNLEKGWTSFAVLPCYVLIVSKSSFMHSLQKQKLVNCQLFVEVLRYLNMGCVMSRRMCIVDPVVQF